MFRRFLNKFLLEFLNKINEVGPGSIEANRNGREACTIL